MTYTEEYMYPTLIMNQEIWDKLEIALMERITKTDRPGPGV